MVLRYILSLLMLIPTRQIICMEESILQTEAVRAEHFLKTRDIQEFKCPPELAYHSSYIRKEIEQNSQSGTKDNPIKVPLDLKSLGYIKVLIQAGESVDYRKLLILPVIELVSVVEGILSLEILHIMRPFLRIFISKPPRYEPHARNVEDDRQLRH